MDSLNALSFLGNYCDLHVDAQTGRIRYQQSGLTTVPLPEIASLISDRALPLLQRSEQEAALREIDAMNRYSLADSVAKVRMGVQKIEQLERCLHQVKDDVQNKSSWVSSAMDHISPVPWTGVWHTGHLIEELGLFKKFLNEEALPRIDQRINEVMAPSILAKEVSKEQRVELLGTLARLMLSKESYQLEGVFRLQGEGEVIHNSMRDVYLALLEGEKLSEENIQAIVTRYKGGADEHELPVMFKQVSKSLIKEEKPADDDALAQIQAMLAEALPPEEIHAEWKSISELLYRVVTTPTTKLNAATLGVAFPVLKQIVQQVCRERGLV